MVATPERDLSGGGERLVLNADGSDRVVIPGGGDLLTADFRQIGQDLLIEAGAGQDVVIKDYFAQDVAPDLLIGGRALLDGALVEKLAASGGGLQLVQNQTTQTDTGPVQLAQTGEAIGKVETVTGTVSVQRADGSDTQLAAGDPIFLNDVVVSGADGSVGIVFIDGTTFSLSSGARMTMDEMVFDPASGGGNFVTSVLQGTFVFSTGSIAPNGNMDVNTPVGTIGIRGTTVAVRIALEGTDTIIMLLPDADGHVGRVIVSNGGGVQEITEANAATTVTSFFIAPGQPVVLPADQVLQYFDDLLQQLRSIEGTGPADPQGGEVEGEEDPDQALLDDFDPSGFSTAAGGEEQAGDGEPAMTDLEPVDKLSSLLGFVPDPLQPVSFFNMSLFGNIGLGSIQFGTGKYGSGITLDYLDPGVNLPPDISPYTILTGGPGNDEIDGGPFTGPLIILGNAGDDTLIGSPENDLIYGLGGNDTLIAGHGGGDDLIDGGDDGDTVKYLSADEPMFIDLTAGKAYGDPDVGMDTLIHIENVVGGSGNDVIIGDKNANKLDGNAGDDQIAGLGGDDIIDGNLGVDTAVFTGKATDYDIFLDEGGSITVVDQRVGGDGSDTISNVEWLQFSDQKASVADLEGGINQAPTDIELSNASVLENAPGAAIGLLTVSDPDAGDAHTFTLSDDRFEVMEGVLRLKEGVAVDFEAGPQQFDITVTASDSGGLIRTETFTINVSDANEAPSAPADADAAANTISEAAVAGTVVGIAVQASDPDAGDTLTYSLTDDAGGRFAIDAVTGVVTVANGAVFDFETETDFQIQAIATDSGGLSSPAGTFTVQIGDAQEAIGPLTDTNADANQVLENAAIGSLVGITGKAVDVDEGDSVTYSLTENAGGRFAIDAATGIVTVAGALDFEDATSHNITVLATSSDGSTQAENFSIAVGNVNDNPVVGPVDDNPATNLVLENAAIGTAVGITALASDADAGTTVTYTLTENAGGRFAIDAATGVVTVAGALDFESATSHNITVLATSSDGSTQAENFSIAVGNVNDNPVVGPVDNNPAANLVLENAAIGTAVGITALASDADAGTTVTYSLTENAGGRFAIDAATGVVTVAGALDFESATSHNITVLATSSDGSTQTEDFSIAVGDVNDVPVANDDLPALEITALNIETQGVNLLINDQIGIDTPGSIDAVALGNGAFVAVDGDGTDIFIKADGTAGTEADYIGKLHINQDGSWTFIQTSDSSLPDVQFSYRVTDSNGDADTASFAVDLRNLTPINYNDVAWTQSVDQQNNIMIVLDTSGSMSGARFQLARDAIANMLGQYDAAGDVNVIVVGFNSSASAMTSWGSVGDALAFIDSLTPAGTTNYASGITAATNILESASLQAQLLDGPTTVYFMSDGDPSSGSSLASNPTVRDAWDAALIENADQVIAVAMGTGVSSVTDPDLTDIADPNGGGFPVSSVVQVSTFSDLGAALSATTATASGNVLDGSLTTGSGDEGGTGQAADKDGDPTTRLASFSYIDQKQGNGTNSLTISWNGVAAIVTGAAAGQVIANEADTVTFTTDSGVMTFFFLDSDQHQAGDFIFIANADATSRSESFHYTTIDGNGDVDPDGGASLTINITAAHSLQLTPTVTNFQPGSLVNSQTGNSNENTLIGDGGNNRLDGAGDDDTINGNDGDDWLIGGSGSDTLNGGAGNDLLDGGTGNDTMSGGTGNDAFIVNSSGDVVLEDANGGVDTVFANTSFTLSDIDVEHLVLTGTGSIDGTGNNAANELYGNASNNKLGGLGGEDYLAGGAGNDTLDGGADNDFLSGGAGKDLMTGGIGADLFHNQSTADNFSVGSNVATSSINLAQLDQITDFDAAVDKVIFSALYDGNGGWAAGHLFTEGVDFSTIAGSYDGTNATSTAFAAGQASLILDGDNNLIYDSNGSAAGYTIVAQIQTADGSSEVTASNVQIT